MNLFLQEEGEGDDYMSKAINKQKFEIFNDIYDNAEKEHDMVIIELLEDGLLKKISK